MSLFQFYGYLSQQQNMMQDYVRTGTYQRAILQNHTDFKDKVSRVVCAPPRALRLRTGLRLRGLFSFSLRIVLFFLSSDSRSRIYFL